jgi:hypothetical protein
VVRFVPLILRSTKESKMTLETIRSALGWCTIINWIVLFLWWLFLTVAHDWMHRTHGRWFSISRERFDEIHYTAMALYKMGIVLFNLAPYLALRIVG